MPSDIKSKVTVVVLNYMNYMETVNCVDSILLQEKVNFDIVIVDNGSSNESFSYLKNRYKNIAKVYVIRARRNYGFAKGNNIGINYARTRLSADYVLLLNSDTVLLGNGYLHTMLQADQGKTGVIGSKIIELDGNEQAPNKEYVDFPATLYFFLYLWMLYWGMTGAAQFFEEKFKKSKTEIILHGCNLLLTPQYLELYGGLYDKTFLYFEEHILFLRCRMAGLKQVKAEQAELRHIGKQSSKFLYKNQSAIREKYTRTSYKHVVLISLKSKLLELIGGKYEKDI